MSTHADFCARLQNVSSVCMHYGCVRRSGSLQLTRDQTPTKRDADGGGAGEGVTVRGLESYATWRRVTQPCLAQESKRLIQAPQLKRSREGKRA
eukprot:6238856-Prymnesium_polylepis.1